VAVSRVHFIVGLSLAAVACTTSSPSEVASGATPVAPSPAPPTARMDVPPATRADVPRAGGDDSAGQWACTDDEDCTMTCALGSVSKTWIDARPDADDCDDGCGWHNGQEKCQQGECVALKDDGTINAQCTRRRK